MVPVGKISPTADDFRSEHGANRLWRDAVASSTARKQGWDMLNTLTTRRDARLTIYGRFDPNHVVSPNAAGLFAILPVLALFTPFDRFGQRPHRIRGLHQMAGAAASGMEPLPDCEMLAVEADCVAERARSAVLRNVDIAQGLPALAEYVAAQTDGEVDGGACRLFHLTKEPA